MYLLIIVTFKVASSSASTCLRHFLVLCLKAMSFTELAHLAAEEEELCLSVLAASEEGLAVLAAAEEEEELVVFSGAN